VVAADKPRFSISGWYHGPAPPTGADQASLQQLQGGDGTAPASSYTPFAGERGKQGWCMQGCYSSRMWSHHVSLSQSVAGKLCWCVMTRGLLTSESRLAGSSAAGSSDVDTYPSLNCLDT
jgi:hypothetical protein